jgi:hypothetical protein
MTRSRPSIPPAERSDDRPAAGLVEVLIDQAFPTDPFARPYRDSLLSRPLRVAALLPI